MRLIKFLCVSIVFGLCVDIDYGMFVAQQAITTKLQETFEGSRPLYVITVTRTGSEVLTPVEMYVVFKILQELFDHSCNEYESKLEEIVNDDGTNRIAEQENLDYSFLETSKRLADIKDKKNILDSLALLIVNAASEYTSKKEILDQIRWNMQLTVFDEYFFGKEKAFAKNYFESIVSEYSSNFNNTIFVINYLKQERKNVSLADIDRTTRIFFQSVQQENLIKLVKPKQLLPELAGRIFNMLWPEYNNILTDLNLISDHVYRAASLQSSINTGLSTYINYLKDLKRGSETFLIEQATLENISVYFFKGKPIMCYNKSTYFDEVAHLMPLNNLWYIYLFGYGVDIIDDLSEYKEVAHILHNNLTTEICRDLVVGVRKDALRKKLHIIQSNTVDMEKYKSNIPQCNVVVHADSRCEGKAYRKNEQELEEISAIFEYAFNMLNKNYKIKVFEINVER